MTKENESRLEPYLKKISEQNQEIIELLNRIVFNSNQSNAQADEGKIIVDKMDSLTKREKQVIELIMQGMLNKQMAYELAVSLSTIEAHRSSVMKKMGVKNITQLTQEYMKFKSLRKF